MIAWVYVEGESDRIALDALWKNWKAELRKRGRGIKVVPLDDKSRYFRKIGSHAAANLIASPQSLIVGLPRSVPEQAV